MKNTRTEKNERPNYGALTRWEQIMVESLVKNQLKKANEYLEKYPQGEFVYFVKEEREALAALLVKVATV